MDNSELENNNETPELDNSQEQMESEETETEVVITKEEEEPKPEEDELTKQRRKQQMEWSKQEVAKYSQLALKLAVKSAKTDANSLVELYKEDPKLADAVAKEFEYDDYNDLKNSLWLWSNEDDFETKYQARKQKEVHEEAIEKVTSKIESLWSIKSQVQEYFDELSEWKQLTYDKAMRLYDMAVTYVKKDALKDEKSDTAKKSLASTSVSSTPKKEESSWWIVRNGQMVKI